uniref:uncharacterized protein LOC120347844 n=1 Tax=Styela clava TaxID=7725 RepID=UPI00193A388A|nr:uncharacterized protein LOC120347844 [Styela clava]
MVSIRYCRLMLKIVILLTHWSIIEANVFTNYKSSKNYTLPTQVGEAGKTISLTCQDDFYVSIPQNNIVVAWKKKPKSEKSWIPLHQNAHILITNCSESQKRPKECLGKNVFSALTIEKLSSTDAGIYACYVKTKWKETVIGKTRLIVGYPPEEPQLAENHCIFKWDDDLMTCCWNPGKQTFIETNFQMKYQMHGDLLKVVNCLKTDNSDVCCKVDVENRFEKHNISLEASNNFGKSASLSHSVIPSLHVKPKVPTNLSLKSKIVNNQMNDIIVKWKEPNNGYISAYVYRVRYSLSQPSPNWKIEYGNSETIYVLENLKSSTEYVIQVSAKPDNINSIIDGVWSSWSKSASIKTDLTVPSKKFTFKRPKTTISFTGRNYSTEITWLPYDNQHESGFVDKISCGKCESNDEVVSELHNATQFVFRTYFGEICCSGRHCNNAGCSEEDSMHIRIEKAPPTIKNVTINKMNETYLLATWNPPSRSESCVIRVCIRMRSSDLNQTEILNPINNCGWNGFEMLKTTDVDCALGAFSIIDDWSPCFLYSITLENHHDEIISQSYPSNIISNNWILNRIDHFHSTDLSTISNFQFDVMWSTIPSKICEHMQPYLIYQPTSGSECADLTKCNTEFMKKV